MNAATDSSVKRGLLIGAGYFSRFHLDAWSRLNGAEIVCVCDLDPEKAQAAAVEFGITDCTNNLLEALRRDDLDFIDIATGPDGRPDLVRQVLQRKLPVICQTPLGNSFDRFSPFRTSAERQTAMAMSKRAAQAANPSKQASDVVKAFVRPMMHVVRQAEDC